jgi:hypothetical protein
MMGIVREWNKNEFFSLFMILIHVIVHDLVVGLMGFLILSC